MYAFKINFNFQKCVNCPLECQGAVISSLEDLYRFKGCTQITGDLTIQIRGGKRTHAYSSGDSIFSLFVWKISSYLNNDATT